MNRFSGRARSSDHELLRNPEGPFVKASARCVYLFGSFPSPGYIFWLKYLYMEQEDRHLGSGSVTLFSPTDKIAQSMGLTMLLPSLWPRRFAILIQFLSSPPILFLSNSWNFISHSKLRRNSTKKQTKRYQASIQYLWVVKGLVEWTGTPQSTSTWLAGYKTLVWLTESWCSSLL